MTKWKWDYNFAKNDGQFLILDEDGYTVFTGQLVIQPGDRPAEYYVKQITDMVKLHNQAIDMTEKAQRMLDRAQAEREGQGPNQTIQINAPLAMMQLVEETKIKTLKEILEGVS